MRQPHRQFLEKFNRLILKILNDALKTRTFKGLALDLQMSYGYTWLLYHRAMEGKTKYLHDEVLYKLCKLGGMTKEEFMSQLQQTTKE